MVDLSPWFSLYKYYKKKPYSAGENHRSFRAWTGTDPLVAEKIFQKYQDITFLPNRTRLLIVLNYLKSMPTEDEGSSSFHITRKTYRKYVWDTLFYLEYIMDEININNRYLSIIFIVILLILSYSIRYSDPLPKGLFENVVIIVDGTDCPINRPGLISDRYLLTNGRSKENISSRYNYKYTIACQISSGIEINKILLLFVLFVRKNIFLSSSLIS